MGKYVMKQTARLERPQVAPPLTRRPRLRHVQMRAEHAAQIHALQRVCFPHTPVDKLFQPAELVSLAERFPQGHIVVLDGERVAGFGAGIFINFDWEHPQHDLDEFVGPACCNHDPDGDYYYGTDISVHPDYRRQGIGRQLYELRKGIVRRYNRKGIVAGGVLPGYVNHKQSMTALEYVRRVAAGELYDPTLTFQLGNGFELRGVLANYFEDEKTGGWASLIYWPNPDYRPGVQRH